MFLAVVLKDTGGFKSNFWIILKISMITMNKNYVEISSDECKGCKLCVSTCPKNSISMSSNINKLGYQYAVFSGDNCTACGFCYYICPEPGAISVIKGGSDNE